MSFSKGQIVIYNSKCCTVFRVHGKKLLTGATYSGYQLKENEAGTVHNNVAASSITSGTNAAVCNDCWSNFFYRGNNEAASSWILEHIIRKIKDSGNAQWGHNNDNTQYYFSMGGTTWTKNVS